VDALLQDLPVNLAHTESGDFEIVEEYDTDEQYGFAVREDDSEELLEAVNEQLQELRDSGRYQEIYDSYFATD
jgi:polar amino acid transport system substrate-binding protein